MDRLRSFAHSAAENLRDFGASPPISSSRAGQPLRASLAKLRVIDLETGDLRALRLGERYACVSHEWSKHPQHLNGQEVTDHIRNQIHRYQMGQIEKYGKLLGLPTAVWIDTLCIDQSDDSDKAYWVPRMGDVYSHACRSYLILPGLDLLAKLQPFLIRHPCGSFHSIQHRCAYNNGACSKGHDFSDDELMVILECVRDIMNHGWRDRIWIAQESVLSPLIHFLDDGSVMDLREVQKLCALIHHERSRYDLETRHWILDCVSWFGERSLMHSLYTADVLGADTTLKFTENMRSTLPADIYYGLCGLLRIDVAYEKTLSVGEVKRKVLQALLDKGDPSWIMLSEQNPGSLVRGTAIPRRGQYSNVPFRLEHKRLAISLTQLHEDGALELSSDWTVSEIKNHFTPRELFGMITTSECQTLIDKEAVTSCLDSIMWQWLWTEVDINTIDKLGLKLPSSGLKLFWRGTINIPKSMVKDLLWPKCLHGQCPRLEGALCCQARNMMLDARQELCLTAVQAKQGALASFVRIDAGERALKASHVLRFAESDIVCAVSKVGHDFDEAGEKQYRFEAAVELLNYQENGGRSVVPRWDKLLPKTTII
ncbi:MAG: hypothetical protein MMC23_001113 [Stictis urceolatum]|nr:hypothetical protein [Stictis urceolata]